MGDVWNDQSPPGMLWRRSEGRGHEAGRRVGLVIMATIVGMAIGGGLSGWIHDSTGSYQAAFVDGIAWNVLDISIMAAVPWRTRGPATADRTMP